VCVCVNRRAVLSATCRPVTGHHQVVAGDHTELGRLIIPRDSSHFFRGRFTCSGVWGGVEWQEADSSCTVRPLFHSEIAEKNLHSFREPFQKLQHFSFSLHPPVIFQKCRHLLHYGRRKKKICHHSQDVHTRNFSPQQRGRRQKPYFACTAQGNQQRRTEALSSCPPLDLRAIRCTSAESWKQVVLVLRLKQFFFFSLHSPLRKAFPTRTFTHWPPLPAIHRDAWKTECSQKTRSCDLTYTYTKRQLRTVGMYEYQSVSRP
jgi:hypothetical protein